MADNLTSMMQTGALPSVTSPLTVEQLYQNVLGRAPDPGGLANWQAAFGSEIDPSEIQQFVQSAQAEKPGAIYNVPFSNSVQNLLGRADPSQTFNPLNPVDSGFPMTPPDGTANLFSAPTKLPLTTGGLSSIDPAAAKNLVTQAYGDIGRTGFGNTLSTIDQPGYDYWTGQLQFGAMTPDQFQSAFSNAVTGYMQANPNDPYTKYVSDFLVNKSYQDVLGRTPETAGKEYWTGQLTSGALNPENIKQTIAYGAQGMDRPAAQTYLGKEIWAPNEYLKGTSGLGYKDIVDYINTHVQNPTDVYLASQKYGISPEEILQAKQAVGGQDIPTIQAIKDYLAQGQAGYNTQFTDVAKSIFGPTSTDLIAKFDPTKYTGKTMDEIRTELQNSPENKLQDAYKLANVARTALGYSDQNAYNLISKAQSGQLNDTEKQIYDTLLKTNTVAGSDYEKLLSYAAVNSPNAPIFQQNPNLLQIYTPLNAQSGTTGQYGYINNAPILNAKFADDQLKDSNSKSLDLGSGTDFGWATSSKYQGRVSQGPGLFGIDIPQYQIDAIKKVDDLIKEQGGLQTRQYTDPETNQTYNEQVLMAEYVDPETGQKGKYLTNLNLVASQFGWGGGGDEVTKSYLEIKNDITNAAKKVGIDPSQYSTLTDLYNALDDKTKNLYQVTGRTGTWDPAAAASVGTNHASVLYQRIGDKLVPISAPQGFNYDDPKSHGFFGDMFHSALDLAGDLLSLPPIQAALIFSGGIPGLFNSAAGVAAGAEGSIQALVTNQLADIGVEKAIQPILTNAIISGGSSGLMTFLTSGGDLEKALKSGAMGAIGGAAGMLGSQYLTGADIPLVGQLTENQAKTIGNLLGGAAVAELAGKDVGEYLKNRAVAMGLGAVASMSGVGEGMKITEADKQIFNSVVSIIKSGKVNPNQIMNLAVALDKSGYLPKAA